MSIITALPNLLQQSLPSLHAVRLNALMAEVEAGPCVDTVLGRALSCCAFIKYKINRLDRLVVNRHLKSGRLAF
jgi:hypothetical protein